MFTIVCVSIMMMIFMAFTPFIACIFTLLLMIIVFVVLAIGLCGVVSIYVIAALFQSVYVAAGGSLSGMLGSLWELITRGLNC